MRYTYDELRYIRVGQTPKERERRTQQALMAREIECKSQSMGWVADDEDTEEADDEETSDRTCPVCKAKAIAQEREAEYQAKELVAEMEARKETK